MRIIEVWADPGHEDTLRGIAEQHAIVDFWVGPDTGDGRSAMRLLVRPEKQQAVIDALQAVLGSAERARLLILPVEATLPRPPDLEAPETGRRYAAGRTREELYNKVASGARTDGTFVLLVLLSTIVAAIGLVEDNVAIVIGAMVIAPLLSPNLALALGAALGDSPLMWQALRTNVVGLGLALAVSAVIGLFLPGTLDSAELLARTDVGWDEVALALVSGAAAVLSLATGLSATLVGVMVAVALLPPTATLGIMLGTGNYPLALGAALLLAVNIVCVNLAAKVVFLFKGVRPRTWLEKQKARQSLFVYLFIWALSLLILLAVIHIRQTFLLGA